MTVRVAILISGSGSNMVALAQSMVGAHPARPCLVLSNDPNAAGLDKARAMGIPTAAIDHKPFRGSRAAFEAALLEPLLAAQPDLVALAGFMRVLTPDFVRRFDGWMLNIHPSLLPKYKGLHTHARAIDAGDSEAGCSVHLVTAELDDGPILGQARVPIIEGDTPDTLAARVLPMEHALYPRVLERVARGERGFLTLP